MLKKISSARLISTEGRKITKHSARVTLCTTLYNNRFSDKAVTSRSHHRSSAVQGYQREQFSILKDISNALEPPTSISTQKVSATAVKPDPENTENSVKANSVPAEGNTENQLLINLPKCVTTVVLVKSDGKKLFWRKNRFMTFPLSMHDLF